MAPLKAILLAFALSALQAHAWVTMASTSIAATPTSKAATTAKAAKLSSLSSQVSGSTKLAATSTAAGTSGAKAVAGTAAKKTASASAAKFSANAAASKAAAASAAKISASNAKFSASSAAASKAAAASAASVNAGVAATGAAVAASGAAFSAGVADAGASFNNGIADLVSSAELAFASMSAGEAAGVVALAVAAGVIVGQSNAQGGNGTVTSFSGESAAVRELRAMNEKLGAKVVEIEDKFVAADAAFEANTEAMRKEFDTTLRVKIDTLRSELQRDKEAALKDMQNAHELQLEEMKSFYTDQYAEKVSELQREITERDKRILELEAAAGDPLSRWFKVRGGGERAEPMSPAYSRVTVARGGGGGVPCRHRVLGKEAGSQTPRGRGQRRPSRRARAWRLTRSSPRLRGKG